MSVYNNVKVLANERNLSIKAIEVSCGLSNGSIQKWDKSMPKADALYQVAQFLGESIEYFLTGIRSDLSDDEKVILNAFRSADALGRARITQVAMNITDEIEKKACR